MILRFPGSIVPRLESERNYKRARALIFNALSGKAAKRSTRSDYKRYFVRSVTSDGFL